MDTNNWRPDPSQGPVGGGAEAVGGGAEPTMDTGDWRTQLPPDSRQRIVNKIMDTLKRHLPVSSQEGLLELKKIATRFEEKIYATATSQTDYLRKISLKMLTMETKSQNPIANSLPSNATVSSNKPPDPVSLDSTAQTGHANGGDWQEVVYQKRNSMVTNNWSPNPSQGPLGGGAGVEAIGGGGEPTMDTGDWRTQLSLDSRQRIVNKIMDILRRHLPVFGQEGLLELKKIAIRFEEKIYAAAISQSDYLRKISLKMLTMETKSQNPIANSLPSNADVSSNKPPYPGMHGLQFQVHNQGQSPPNPLLANQSQAYQQLLSQNIQNSIPSTEVPIGANFPSAMPPISGLNQTSIRNVVGQDMNVQNIFGTSQNLAFANNQWQMQGRHQEVPLQQQQSQIPQQNLYQQQLQQQLLKQKLQQGSIPHLLVQPHIQQKKTQQLQQQQNLLGANQLQSSQQSVMQTSFFVQPSVTQSYPLSGLQQNQQPSIQQATQSMVQQYPQSVLMQQQQPQQAAVLHQHQTPMLQQPVLPPQQQLMGQLSNASNMQQDLLLSQWSGVGNMQQHQQQLGFQSTISVLQRQQPQLLGTQSINSSMQTKHHPEHMLQQSGFLLQSQSQQSTPDLLPTRGKQLQSQRQPPQQQRQQLIYQIQSQPSELHQEPNSLHRDLLLHRLQASGQESSFKYHIWLLFSLVIICTSIYFIFNILGG